MVEAARGYIRRIYGTDYLADAVAVTRQIAPTDVERLPEDLPGAGVQLYGLIWRRFVAAQLRAAVLRESGARLLVGYSPAQPFPLELHVSGGMVAFDAWLRLLPEHSPELGAYLPELPRGDTGQVIGCETEVLPQPDNDTPAALVVAHGLDRPKVWATALTELLARESIGLDTMGRLHLTDSGTTLLGAVLEHHPALLNKTTVATLREGIAAVRWGEAVRADVLRAFYQAIKTDAKPAEHKPVRLHPIVEADA